METVSIIDYIYPIENGIAVIMSLNINDIIYEFVYWFDKENNWRIKFEDKFYKHFNIKDIYKYKYLIDLIYYIETNMIIDKKDLFNQLEKN